MRFDFLNPPTALADLSASHPDRNYDTLSNLDGVNR
jgi:hypothetical protein